MKELRKFKKMRMQVEMLDKHIPGWEHMDEELINKLYEIKLKEAGVRATEKTIM